MTDNAHPAEWHAARRAGIGGSDWQHVLGIEPYGCRRRVWYAKRDTPQDVPERQTGAMRRGTMIEGALIRLYQEDHCGDEFAVLPWGHSPRPDHLPEWWIGNVDAYVGSLTDDDAVPMVLEIKSKAFRSFSAVHKAAKAGRIPEGEWLQVQHYLGLTGLDRGVYFCVDAATFPVDADDTAHYVRAVIDRDEEALEMMRRAGDLFWRQVENGPAPDQLDAGDHRCSACPWRVTCQGAAMFGADAIPAPGDYTASDDPALADLIREHLELKAVRDAAEEALDDCRARIETAVGDTEAKLATVSGKVIVATRAGRESVKVADLRAADPELARRIVKTGAPYREVRTYPVQRSKR